MTTLKDFVKGKEFSNAEEQDTIPFPEGKTALEIDKVSVEEKEVEFDGVKKKRYILAYKDVKYWAGPQIMEQIQNMIDIKQNHVVVKRKGTGIKTKYVVLPGEEPSQDGDV